MPEALWRSAARLAESDGISATARALGLNYANLKRRVQSGRRPAANRNVGAAPLFVEVGQAALAGSSEGSSQVEPRCVVEIAAQGGRHLAIRFEGERPSELASLCAALWEVCR
jgi:hypothetical protein